jgi:hypothetical protein
MNGSGEGFGMVEDGFVMVVYGGDGWLFMRLMIVMIDKSGGEYGVVML